MIIINLHIIIMTISILGFDIITEGFFQVGALGLCEVFRQLSSP